MKTEHGTSSNARRGNQRNSHVGSTTWNCIECAEKECRTEKLSINLGRDLLCRRFIISSCRPVTKRLRWGRRGDGLGRRRQAHSSADRRSRKLSAQRKQQTVHVGFVLQREGRGMDRVNCIRNEIDKHFFSNIVVTILFRNYIALYWNLILFNWFSYHNRFTKRYWANQVNTELFNWVKI